MQVFGGVTLFVVFLAVGIAQLYGGFIGFEYFLGTGWAWAVMALAMMTRLMLPLTIGSFFGALNVWGWPWYGALLFAAPGLLFVAPAMIATAVDGVRK